MMTLISEESIEERGDLTTNNNLENNDDENNINNQTLENSVPMTEAEKEFKKMNDRISETREAMQASYLELMAESQASANRVCKTTIPELMQSVNKVVDTLKSHYGIA